MVETQTSYTTANSALAETQNPLSGGRGASANSIYISDKAKQKVLSLMQESGVADDASSCGCSWRWL
jgi:hypothetical protein